jgi:hypothetical protein
MRKNKGEFETFRLERSELREEIAAPLTRLLTAFIEKNKVKNGGQKALIARRDFTTRIHLLWPAGVFG